MRAGWLCGMAIMAAVAGTAFAAQAPQTVTLLGYKTQVPGTWTQQPPESGMRLTQFQVPAAPGQEAGQVVVFYFGRGGGGSVADNVARWESQFSAADGKPVKAALKKAKVGAMPVTHVELNGSYARGVGMGQQGVVKPNQTLLASVVETPQGNLTFHLYGPKATVALHRKAFEQMVAGLK